MRRIICYSILLSALVFFGSVFAYDNQGYPYKDTTCRSDGPSDDYGFRRNNCTSYAAFVLNLYGVPFNNRYEGVDWHDGNNWDNAADSAGISKSSDPLPGDIAQWDSLSNYGHVAFVEKVYYDVNGYVEAIDVTEYNYDECVFGSRKLYANSSNYPDNFIHVLAHNEAVTGMHYLDCYEMDSLCPNQTKDEWRGILQKVWNDYRCKNCSSNYSTAYVDTLAKAIGGMGGGPGTETLPTEPPTSNPPDLIVTKSWLETPWGAETYKYGNQETIKMKAQFKNIGDGDVPSDSPAIEVHFYLSKGYKEDPHSGDGSWRRVGTDFIQPENMKQGDTQTETEGLIVSNLIAAPGVYNVVACIDHTQDDHNNGGAIAEEHESNNCSTETVFEVTADGQINFPTYDFITSSFSFLQAPYYAGDQARFGGYITNIGSATSPASIRSNYSVKCNSGSLVQLTDDGTDASDLTPGKNNWEQNDDPVTMPNTPGSCIAYFCADYQGAVTETDEANNCSSFPFYLQPRPMPNFVAHDLAGSPTFQGNQTTVWYQILNNGPVNSPVDIYTAVELYVNGSWVQIASPNRVRTDHATAGYNHAEGAVTNPLNFPAGTYPLRIRADVYNAVAESNEEDNIVQSSLTLWPIVFRWSYAGPISGMVCTQIVEAAEPSNHTWNDNYFCANQDYGMRWSSAGPISGMRCTQIHESADPNTWMDNYLCVPTNSPIQFYWSGAGPVPGKRCVQWNEPADHHTWNDNFLCTD